MTLLQPCSIAGGVRHTGQPDNSSSQGAEGCYLERAGQPLGHARAGLVLAWAELESDSQLSSLLRVNRQTCDVYTGINQLSSMTVNGESAHCFDAQLQYSKLACPIFHLSSEMLANRLMPIGSESVWRVSGVQVELANFDDYTIYQDFRLGPAFCARL